MLGLHASMTVTPHGAAGGGTRKREADNVFLFFMYGSLCKIFLSTLGNLVVLELQSMWTMHDKAEFNAFIHNCLTENML